MIWYLIIFFLSSGLMYFSCVEKNQISLRKFLVFLALLFPILLATLRKENVGIDVSTYMRPLFDASMKSTSYSNFREIIASSYRLHDMDIGYANIAYLSSKVFRSVHGIFFVNEILIIVPFIFGLYNFEKYLKRSNSQYYELYSRNKWIAFTMFLFVFFNNSLNQARQLIVCSLIFWSISLILNKKYVLAIVLFACSFTIHSSSIVFIYMLIVLWLIFKGHKKLTKTLYIFLLTLLIAGPQLFFFAANLIKDYNIIPQKYLGLIYEVRYESIDINITYLFLQIILLILAFTLRKKDVFIDFLVAMLLTFVCLLNFASRVIPIGRIQYYFIYFCCLILPFAKLGLKKYTNFYNLANVILILLLLIFWFGAMYSDFTGTSSYLFFWQ